MSRTTGQHNFSTMRGLAMKTNTQNERSHRLAMAASLRSGEGGIRTHGALACTLVFETSTIGHSVTSPSDASVARIILRGWICFQWFCPGRAGVRRAGRRPAADDAELRRLKAG